MRPVYLEEATMRATCLGLLILAALLLGAAWAPQHAGSSAATPVAAASLGGGAAQKLARSLIGLPVTQGEGCLPIGGTIAPSGADLLWGDLDCGGSLTIAAASPRGRP